MKMTNEEYKDFSDKRQPRSKVFANICKAFLVGGLICCIGQLITDLFRNTGLSLEDAGSAASVSLVLIGAVLTGLGIYDKLAEFAGGGTLVPITGFANSVVAPALEFKTEGLVTGTAAKMFVIAGPVIVYGIGASAIYGLILLLVGAA